MAKARFEMKPLQWEDGRFKVILFALTGFGNVALKTLWELGCDVQCVVTRKEFGVFPYYKEESLTELAKGKAIVMEDPDLRDWHLKKLFESLRPDLILVSTFHRLIPADIAGAARYAINIHPALLPKYRGATPFTWMLMNGEKQAGLTAHFVTDAADGGDIVAQKEVAIDPNDTEGSLRGRLAQESADVVRQIVEKARAEQMDSWPQDESQATKHPRRKLDEPCLVDLRPSEARTPDAVHNLIRAHLPFPGARVKTTEGEILPVIESRMHNGVLKIQTKEKEIELAF